MSRARIGIAGAGIMGRVLAWQLSRAGYDLTLFDQDPVATGSAAAYTAAGMLAPYSELEASECQIYEQGKHSLTLWPELLRSLDAEPLLHPVGSLVVAHPQDKACLQQFDFTLRQKLMDDGGVQFLDADALGKREPQLATQFTQATYLAGESWIDTHALMQRLAAALRAAGVTWYAESMVTGLACGEISTSQQRHGFDWVVDCRGIGARDDIQGLRGVRGELLEVHAPEIHLRHLVRLMHPRYGLYLVPRAKHHFILGATQIESEDTSPISVRSAMELLSALYVLHPGFAEARIVDTRTNVRPALPDNLPAIFEQPGLTRINGLFRHGYLLAPVMAEQVVALIERELSNERMTPASVSSASIASPASSVSPTAPTSIAAKTRKAS